MNTIRRGVRVHTATAVLAVVVAIGCGQDSATAPTSPAASELVTSDITNFWDAYDAGGKDGSSTAFQQYYLDRASTGLRDFIVKRAITAASLAQMVRAYPRYFAAIRANSLGMTASGALLDRIHAVNTKLRDVYPPAVFPPVTLLVGRFSTGGTTAQSGMLIGTEFYAIDESTPLDELGTFQRSNVHSADSLQFIVAHESIHIQQGKAGALHGDGSTLLEQAFMEGSADFLGELTSGGIINGKIYEWALPRESSIWADFKTEMNGLDVSRWLYNQGTATADRPGDLGYFVGYRIARAFYNSQPDKGAAIRDIIEARDVAGILSRSGYNP